LPNRRKPQDVCRGLRFIGSCTHEAVYPDRPTWYDGLWTLSRDPRGVRRTATCVGANTRGKSEYAEPASEWDQGKADTAAGTKLYRGVDEVGPSTGWEP
jgi:hypothetical protein